MRAGTRFPSVNLADVLHRHRRKTAISRTDYSRPIKLALSDGVIAPDSTVFDFGCGRGDDVRYLGLRGIDAWGWDPGHRPTGTVAPAQVVNVGYVVNVIEDAEERAQCLMRAWSFTERALIVSARLTSETPDLVSVAPYGDGFVTSLPTFQKFYEQAELKNWLEDHVSESAVAAGPGVFYVFRGTADRMAFLASRYRRRGRELLPSVESTIEDHKELLRPLVEFFERTRPNPGRGRATGRRRDPEAVRKPATGASTRSTRPRCRGVEAGRHRPRGGSPHLPRALEVRREGPVRAAPACRAP